MLKLTRTLHFRPKLERFFKLTLILAKYFNFPNSFSARLKKLGCGLILGSMWTLSHYNEMIIDQWESDQVL